MADRRPHLSLILGQGARRDAPPAELMVLPKLNSHVSQMTLFGGWAKSGLSKKRILSVGFDSIDFEGFKYLLAISAVRYVVDTRLLASFRSRGFAADSVSGLFDNLGIKYLRPHELANRFVGTSSNTHVVLRSYIEHIKSSCQESVRQIGQLLTRGNVLVLGRDSNHFGNERQLLVDWLAELHRPVEVVVLSSCRGNEFTASSYVVGSIIGERVTSRLKGKKRRKTTNGSQHLLNDLQPSRRSR